MIAEGIRTNKPTFLYLLGNRYFTFIILSLIFYKCKTNKSNWQINFTLSKENNTYIAWKLSATASQG